MIPSDRAGRGLRAALQSSVMACLVAGLFTSCLVGPPSASFRSDSGVVRADRAERAAEIAAALEELTPRVLELVPGTRARRLEVWVQDVPALYAFQTSAYSDADGFFAEGMSRVHLREGSEHVERTLAHELVHASLDGAWERLPGTLEEGLCDVVSARLCPDAALALSTGRLSSAAFATGGLLLDLELALSGEGAGEGDEAEIEVGWTARLRLDAEPRVRIDPLRVFDLQAGLSTSRLTAAEKRSYYGVAFLIVSRIVDRVGFDGLHALCVRAEEQGQDVVPTDVLLEAAGLTPDRASLRDAIEEALGPAELGELVRAHPEFLVGTIARFLSPTPTSTDGASAVQSEARIAEASEALSRLSARVRISGARAPSFELTTLHAWRPRLESELRRAPWPAGAPR